MLAVVFLAIQYEPYLDGKHKVCTDGTVYAVCQTGVYGHTYTSEYFSSRYEFRVRWWASWSNRLDVEEQEYEDREWVQK